MSVMSITTHRARTAGAAAVMLALSILAPGVAAAAQPLGETAKVTEQADATAVPPELTAQQAADLGVSNAALQQVEQSIAVIDRATGQVVASLNGDRAYNTESILKLFTAAYYLIQAEGEPAAWMTDDLRTMIEVSDNGIQSALWSWDIIPTIADRYGLQNTTNGPYASDETWGSDRTTANDQARFLYAMSLDPLVGPNLMAWMAGTERTGADGFNQAFGLNALSGEHGSKQGWSDPGWTPANMHSVGWAERYFAAILQSSPTATYATMRATSTHSAQLIDSVFAPPAGLPDAATISEWVTESSLPETIVGGLRSFFKASDLDDLAELTSAGTVAMEIFGIDNTEC